MGKKLCKRLQSHYFNRQQKQYGIYLGHRSPVCLAYVVKVSRHKLDGQRIYVQSETTRYKDVVLQKSVNGWAFGNILLGGLIGWGVDLGTNAVSKPAQEYFYINANDVQGQRVQQNTNYNNNTGAGVEAL